MKNSTNPDFIMINIVHNSPLPDKIVSTPIILKVEYIESAFPVTLDNRVSSIPKRFSDLTYIALSKSGENSIGLVQAFTFHHDVEPYDTLYILSDESVQKINAKLNPV